MASQDAEGGHCSALLINNVTDVKTVATVLGLILGSAPRKFRICCVWASKQEVANGIAEAVQSANLAHNDTEPVQVYYSQELMSQKFLKQESITTLLLAMGTEEHAAFLSDFFRNSSNSAKHIFSLGLPCQGTKSLAALNELHEAYKQRLLAKNMLPADWGYPPQWLIFEPGRYETFLNKVARILPDVGEALGASILMSDVPLELDPDLAVPEIKALAQNLSTILCQTSKPVPQKQQSADAIIKGFTSASGMLRKIFGCNVVSVIGFTNFVEGLISNAAATVLMTNGVCANVVCGNTEQVFELVVWGSAGRIRVHWNSKLGLYECNRELNHFEHPTMMPATGSEWSVALFADVVLSCGKETDASEDEMTKRGAILNTPQRNAPAEIWIDLAVSEGVLSSDGAPVCFQPVVV